MQSRFSFDTAWAWLLLTAATVPCIALTILADPSTTKEAQDNARCRNRDAVRRRPLVRRVRPAQAADRRRLGGRGGRPDVRDDRSVHGRDHLRGGAGGRR